MTTLLVVLLVVRAVVNSVYDVLNGRYRKDGE